MSRKENVIISRKGEKCTDEEMTILDVFSSTNRKKTVKKKSIWSFITLEPMWLGITISLSMSLITYKNLFLQRACMVDLGYSEEMCLNSEGTVKAEIELQTQKIVTSLSVASGFIGGFISSVIFVFLGPWSDSSGRRKPLIILPLLGIIITTIGLLAMQAFPKVSTIWVIYTKVIPLAIGGNYPLLVIAAFSYLGDICYKTGRCATTVMGSNTGALSAFTVIGSIAGPFLYRTVGFVGVFSISLVLETASLVYVIVKVYDINVAEKIPNIFDLTLPIQALKCIFKKREGSRRKNVLLMVIVLSSNSIDTIEQPLSYMYLRNQFVWTEVEFGLLVGFQGIIQVIGTLIIVKLMKHKFKMRDEVIGVVGAISQLIASIAFMFSCSTWMIFTFSVFGFLKNGVMIAERPVLIKQIVASEQGKINSITAVLDKCASFVLMPLANYIYYATLDFLPSSFLIIKIVTSILQVVCFALVKNEPIVTELVEEEPKE